MQSLRDHARVVRRSRLEASLRTVVACSIVGTLALYSPGSVRHLLAYPAFSYLTTVLIMTDATVGGAFRGFWHVVYATVQVMLFSVLSLWLVRPARFTPAVAAALTSLASFLVAVPESTHLMSKRIAFGQIVIVYAGAEVHGAATSIVMHPTLVALSSVLGACAAVLALLLPYPRLSCSEIRKITRLYVENATGRLNFYMDAFYSRNEEAATQLVSMAAFSSRAGAKLLQDMKKYEEGMIWERPDIQLLRQNYKRLAERFQEMELPIRGMELALNSCSSFPTPTVDEELRSMLTQQKLVMARILEQAKCLAPFDATTAPETVDDSNKKSLLAASRTVVLRSIEDLSALFFLFCILILQGDLPMMPIQTLSANNDKKPKFSVKEAMKNLKPSSKCLVFASKCSISLGLALLLGLMYNRENGHWSGLTIAISFVMERQPAFTFANARAQGTAMGSVYGILCLFIFERFMDLRLLALLPWIVFASFLRRSRMYGEAGGMSAIIGALLILGRKNYGVPTVFAVARIVEATIGLICFIVVEILFDPARAGTLAEVELSRSLGQASECIKGMSPYYNEKDLLGSASMEFRQRLSQLKARISGYERYTREAEVEPNFWFCPFPASCHLKLLESLLRTVDLLHFLAFQVDTLKQQCWIVDSPWKDVPELLKEDMELFTGRIGSTIECLGKVTSIKTLSEIDKELQRKTKLHDIEMGKLAKTTPSTSSSCIGKEELEKILNSLLQSLREAMEQINARECKEEAKSQMALSLGSFGFCINKLAEETRALQDLVKELITRHNPSCHVNLFEISSKVDAL
ncbi:hypothetical protein SAY87_008959 [Trapa incisa]|uniref:Integral membrane bound transporter domain-containing protein n=1 Tax=Trapa incisa TaxID=236973 RepID=A0AAN7JXY8_9MYRT|nr:hypothetical protein SAY87_008959 [Trapa incisa]